MKNKILIMLTIALGIAPAIQAMEYSGPADEPGDKSGKEEIVEVEEITPAPQNMLKMLSSDGHEFFVDTQVAQESPQIASALKFKIQQGQPLIYKSELSSDELQALIALLRLQHTTPYLQKSDVDKIDAILINLSEEEQERLLDEALNYFELPIAAFYTILQLAKQKLTSSIEETAKDITSNTNLQNVVIKYYQLMDTDEFFPEKTDAYYSIQDLINFNLFPEVENGTLDLGYMNINDFTGWENIPHKESITELDLSSNKISHLPANLFNGFDNLKRLNLSNNNISDLPTGIFNGLNNLKRLHLSDNNISDLPTGIFNGLNNLKRLGLGSNQLTNIPSEKLKNLKNLEDLQLYDNKIDDTETLNVLVENLQKLKFLNLAGNLIPVIKHVLIPKVTTIWEYPGKLMVKKCKAH